VSKDVITITGRRGVEAQAKRRTKADKRLQNVVPLSDPGGEFSDQLISLNKK
jgi:hypothetical protein